MYLLSCYSRRWKTLSLDSGVDASHLQPLGLFTREDLPLLETVYAGKLALIGGAHPSAPLLRREDPTPFARLLPQLPSLRSFHSEPGYPLTLDIASTYRRLTQLTLGSSILPTVALRQIATSCRALNTLTLLSFLSPSQEDVALTQAAPVDWPSLRELNLHLGGVSYHSGSFRYDAPLFPPVLKGTFDSILAPQLRRLFVELGSFASRPIEDIVPFQDFITSSPRLTHLYILGYNALDAEYLSRCLQFAPALTSLTVRPLTPHFSSQPYVASPHLPTVTDAFREWIPKLLSSLDRLGSCPEMETFDCGGCTPGDVNLILKSVQGDYRSSTLKHLRVDLGFLHKEGVLAVTSADLTERLGVLRETKGISVKLEWKVPETIKFNYPSAGVPIEYSPWASDSYLNQPLK
ncbi:hypothetical protein AAF712_002930 [Marasmius tenuissimus]|uniref:Uncharacterized protein n=1 Tax=Marasmius tenuissimus TaxID=585030 RepID=A0ABR3A8L4_9AGAR